MYSIVALFKLFTTADILHEIDLMCPAGNKLSKLSEPLLAFFFQLFH